VALPVRQLADSGFTLIETLVAALLAATVVVNLAALGAIAIRTTSTARRQTSASLLATQKMEQLLALTWVSAGEAGVAVSDLTTDLSHDPPVTGGSGLAPSPHGALDGNISGYVDYLDEAGVWVGTGPAPPPRGVYVRRWSIEPMASDQNNLLVLQVFVTTVEAARRQVAGSRVRQPGDAYVADVKVRVGQ
jgi:hypothetical protein